MTGAAVADVTARCFDAECGWTWSGVQGEAVKRATAHRTMFPGHSVEIQPLVDVSDNGEPTTWPCKIAGCSGRASRKLGPTAYLCPEHAAARREAHRGRRRKAPLSLDQLTENVRQAQRAVTAAYEAWEEAVARLRQELREERAT